MRKMDVSLIQNSYKKKLFSIGRSIGCFSLSVLKTVEKVPLNTDTPQGICNLYFSKNKYSHVHVPPLKIKISTSGEYPKPWETLL